MKSREWVPGILIILALIGFSRLSPSFFDIHFLLANSTLYAEIGLLALGMTFVIITGNIDLSVGANMILTGCLTAKLMEGGCPMVLAILAGCVMGTFFGFLNGWLVAKLELPSFLVTLGTMAFYRGAAQAMLGPVSVKLPPEFKGVDTFTFVGLPWPLFIFVAASLICGLVLHRTVFGRWVFAVGTNEAASRYSGIPVDRVKILTFALTGLFAGISALLLDSRLGIVRHDLSRGIELDAITVAVLGGVSILGGKGTILGTFLALFLIAVLKTGMGLGNVKAEYQLTIIGVLLIVAALSMNFAELMQKRFQSRSPAKPA